MQTGLRKACEEVLSLCVFRRCTCFDKTPRHAVRRDIRAAASVEAGNVVQQPGPGCGCWRAAYCSGATGATDLSGDICVGAEACLSSTMLNRGSRPTVPHVGLDPNVAASRKQTVVRSDVHLNGHISEQ